jgi:hypothetical protein
MSSAIPDITNIPLRDAARFLNVTPARLRELVDAGAIPCERGGLRIPLVGTIGAAADGVFKFTHLMAYLQQCQREAAQQARQRAAARRAGG